MGIEPTDEGFADLSLTTWVPRRNNQYIQTSRSFQRRIDSNAPPLKSSSLTPAANSLLNAPRRTPRMKWENADHGALHETTTQNGSFSAS